jgi:hypothetical protein
MLGVAVAGKKPPPTLKPEDGINLLNQLDDHLKKQYYDPTLGGIDLKSRFAEATEQMRRATTTEKVYQVMERVIQDLPDAKLYRDPKPREYGYARVWKARPVGGKFYITFVLNRSDAAKKLKVGDELLSVNGSPPTHDMMGLPNSSLATEALLETERLVVTSPGEKAREVVVRSEKRQIYPEFFDLFGSLFESRSWTAYVDRSVMIWRLPSSSEPWPRMISRKDVEPNFNKVPARAQKYPNLIIDLRGNSRGSIDEMGAVAAALFDHDVTVASRVGAGSKQPLVAETSGAKHYGGRVIVLVDKQTGGPAEVLARAIQIDRRGEIIGDQTCGCTRERDTFLLVLGGIKKPLDFFRLSIPIADFVMSDGENLEGKGLTPNQTVLPSGADIASGRDTGLEAALKLAGVPSTSKKQSQRQMIQWHLQ